MNSCLKVKNLSNLIVFSILRFLHKQRSDESKYADIVSIVRRNTDSTNDQ